ncbi:ribbon-helix-helix domain-containing protein [Methylosinus sp. LW4]|uniref:ribbon-helix-helix domain-containing protein n=1 Tax=Methylosinus sp. LW4 TaxID=136993 RepID=UPI00047583E4|nr:type II toxin-antitoxin system ParD family antitoxin [Methylosinus sp. LW4]
MRSTQQFSVTLPTEMARMVKAKVSSGEYASESEVIRDGLRALLARDRAVESWLLQEVAPAYDRMKADPSRGRSAVEVRTTLAAEHERTTKTTP